MYAKIQYHVNTQSCLETAIRFILKSKFKISQIKTEQKNELRIFKTLLYQPTCVYPILLFREVESAYWFFINNILVRQ